MSGNVFLMGLAVVFLLLSCFLFGINRILKTTMQQSEKILAVLLIPAFAACAYWGVSGALSQKNATKSHLYIAYKYLSAGMTEQAVEKVKPLAAATPSKVDAFAIENLADSLSGNYKQAQAGIKSYLLLHQVGSEERKLIDSLKGIVEKGKAVLAVSDAEERTAAQEELKRMIDSAVQHGLAELPDDRAMEKMDSIFLIEKQLQEGDTSGNLVEEAARLEEKNPGDGSVKKLAVRVMLQTGNGERALQLAREIAAGDGSLENKILLTDIVAEQTRPLVNTAGVPGNSLLMAGTDEEDAEAVKLQRRIESLERKAAELEEKRNSSGGGSAGTSGGKLQKQLDLVIKEANDTRKRLSSLPVLRAINYMESSRPLFGSDRTIYDLQLSKLYYAADRKEQAKALLQKAMDGAGGEEDALGVRQTLQDIQSTAGQNPGRVDMDAVTPRVDELVERLGGGYTGQGEGSLSREFRNFIVSDIKYDKVDLFINQLDQSNYPDMKAFINVGVEKKGFFGISQQFVKKDFLVEDTDTGIEPFELESNTNGDINICLVFDRSGSMQGRPVEDAKAAGISFAENLGKGEKVSVAAFNTDAVQVCGLTDDRIFLENSINSITADGGTSISGGLNLGVGMLKDIQGSRAIILLSDGKDENADPGAIEGSIRSAKNQGIPVYTVGFGEIDEAYLGNIADSTGGRFFMASSTAELVDIYAILQKYIQNNYVIRYKVDKNLELEDRYLDVKLKDKGGEDLREYSLRPDEEETGEISEDAFAAFMDSGKFVLTGVVNGTMSSSDVKNGMLLDINGLNVPADVRIKIGGKPAAEVQVTDGNSLHVRLPGDLAPGTYDITGISGDGTVSKLNNALNIYRPGELNTLKVGEITVNAAAIEKTGPATYVARGNVRLNGVVRSAGDVTITVNNESTEQTNEFDAGELMGSSKLYVSFNGTKGTFVQQVLQGRELVVSDKDFRITTRKGSESELKSDKGLYMDIWAFSFEAGTVSVQQDGLQIKALSFGFEDFGGKNAVSRLKKTLKCFPVEGELTFRVTEKDVLTKAKVNFNLSRTFMQIPGFAVLKASEAGMELDTMSPEKKLELSGKFALSFCRKNEMEFKYSAYKENLALPDEITVKIAAGDGIKLPPAGMVSIDALGGGVGTLYDAILKKDLGNVSLVGLADVSVGKSPVKLPFIGEVKALSFEELKLVIKLNFSRFAFSGKVKVLGKEMAQGEATLENKGDRWDFEVKSKGELKLGLLVCDIGINGECYANQTSDGMLLDYNAGVSYDDKIGDKDFDGKGDARISFNDDLIVITVSVSENGQLKRAKFAVDKNESILNLSKKFEVEIDF